MERIDGVIQHYDWGDPLAIPQLLGKPGDGRPVAELWFGTHPSAPAHLHDGRDLEAHAGALPFLVKFLSAAKALSLQVHPSADHAVEGFRRENAAGIPLDSPTRIYRDPYAKPEILCALTSFEALCGIAPIGATRSLLTEIGPAAYHLRLELDREGPRGAIAFLLQERPDITALVTAARDIRDPRCQWLTMLVEQHPNDPSAAIALLLNYVMLRPGQAIFLGPGNLHAYLRGTGVEVLASSDNVVRCGLTSKHVDAAEVLRVLDTTVLDEPIIAAEMQVDGGWHYPAPTTEFDVTRYEIHGQRQWIAKSTELVLCTEGSLNELHAGECAVVLKGEEVELFGAGTVFRIRSDNTRR